MIVEKRQGYQVEIDEQTGGIVRLVQAGLPETHNAANKNGRLGTLSVSSDLQAPRFQVRLHQGLTEGADDIPPKDFVTVQDFSPPCTLCQREKDMVAFENNTYHTRVEYHFFENSIQICASADSAHISQFGLNFAFNFLGLPQSGYSHQLLPSSPYTAESGALTWCTFVRPSGRCIAVSTESAIDGWKIDYSEYNYGHFILNFKILEAFDACYKAPQPSVHHELCVWLDFAATEVQAAQIVCKRTELPVPLPKVGGGAVGAVIPVPIEGLCNRAVVAVPDGQEYTAALHTDAAGRTVAMVPLVKEGFHNLRLYASDGRWLDSTLYAYRSLQELYALALDSIHPPYHAVDKNLAEGIVWCWAILGYARNYKKAKETWLAQACDLLDNEIIGSDPAAARPRECIWPQEQVINGRRYAPYHLYASTRVQEQFFALSVLLEGYRALKKEKYLEQAVLVGQSLLKDHIAEQGCVWRLDEKGQRIDYSTVAAPVIAFVDLYRVLEAQRHPAAEQFREASLRMADYLVKRGMNFPTEGDQSFSGVEMEDGSISCTALSVLYVAWYIEPRPNYLPFAKKILDLHEAWVTKTPDVRMYRSTMRWWETLWEGDQDGPCICAGHAWTIWRAEADYYYALLSGDIEHAERSYCGYLTNWCKVQPDGEMTACYVPDFIPYRTAQGQLGHHYPQTKDRSLSRYVWARAVDSWLVSAGICVENGEAYPMNLRCEKVDAAWHLYPAGSPPKILFVRSGSEPIWLHTEDEVTLVSDHPLVVVAGTVLKMDSCRCLVEPQNGVVVFAAMDEK